MTDTAPPHAAPVRRRPTVAARTQPRGCMIEGCQLETFAMVICPGHWNLLPGHLAAGCWAAYVAGYENGSHPSNDYKATLRACVEWLTEHTEIPSG